MITISVDGEDFEVPSSAADVNWAAKQVAFEQAVVAYVDDVNTLAEAAAPTATVAPTAVVGTAGSGEGISGAATNYGRHVVHKISLSYTALGVDDTTKDVTLWTLPAKTRVLRVIADVTQEFLGGLIADVTLVVGNSTGGDEYLLTQDVFAGVGTYGASQAELGDGVVGGTGFSGDLTWSSTTVVQCRFVSDEVMSALTQGAATFYIECCTYP